MIVGSRPYYLSRGSAIRSSHWIDIFWIHRNIFAFSIISQCWNGTGSWNPSSWMMTTLLSYITEMKRSSGWLPWYSQETLKTIFNVSSEYQGCHPDGLPVCVIYIVNTTQIAKVMGHTWVLSAPGGPHVGPMNLAIRVLLPIDFRRNGPVTWKACRCPDVTWARQHQEENKSRSSVRLINKHRDSTIKYKIT